MSALVECVPNFSEGRDPAKIARIRAAIEGIPGAFVLHETSDPDHHRTVLTCAGEPQAMLDAMCAAAAVAVDLINLREHAGVHPRLGALDVVPFVPVRDIQMADCVALARRCGERLWHDLGLPVYFYEEAALSPERRRLEQVRLRGWEHVRETLDQHPPDVGLGLHPTAGAAVVGAREYLLAININLKSEDLSAAKDFARRIRASSGGLPGVKALGLRLESRGQVQVSLNLTRLSLTPFHVVFELIRSWATERGIQVAETELIGLAPRRVIDDAARYYLRLSDFTPGRTVEGAIEDCRLGRENREVSQLPPAHEATAVGEGLVPPAEPEHQ